MNFQNHFIQQASLLWITLQYLASVLWGKREECKLRYGQCLPCESEKIVLLNFLKYFVTRVFLRSCKIFIYFIWEILECKLLPSFYSPEFTTHEELFVRSQCTPTFVWIFFIPVALPVSQVVVVEPLEYRFVV